MRSVIGWHPEHGVACPSTFDFAVMKCHELLSEPWMTRAAMGDKGHQRTSRVSSRRRAFLPKCSENNRSNEGPLRVVLFSGH